MKGVIFDLDKPIIYNSLAESLRNSRNWPQFYELIYSFSIV